MFRMALLILGIGFVALLIMQVLGQKYSPFGNLLIRLSVKDVPITAELVSTPDKTYLGLSHRQRPGHALPHAHSRTPYFLYAGYALSHRHYLDCRRQGGGHS